MHVIRNYAFTKIIIKVKICRLHSIMEIWFVSFQNMAESKLNKNRFK